MYDLTLSALGRRLKHILPHALLALAALAYQPPAIALTPAEDSALQAGAIARPAQFDKVGKGPLLPDDVAVMLAEYADGDIVNITTVLRQLGMQNAAELARQERLSSTALLQLAYSAAEQAEPDSGKPFLSAFIMEVATGTPAMLQEHDVVRFVRDNPSERTRFAFAARPAMLPVAAIEPDVRTVIALVAEVTATRGSPVASRLLLKKHLGLSEGEVLEALRRYGTGDAALAAMLTLMPNPPQKQRLAEIALEIFSLIPAARNDRLLSESIFRWLGLGDARFGEWFRYRDIMIDRTEAGDLGVDAKRLKAAQQAVALLRKDMPIMLKRYADLGHPITVAAIERMHFEYINRQPMVAALWGFTVISLKRDFNDERYLPERAASMRRELAGPIAAGADIPKDWPRQPDGSLDYIALARMTGPKPRNGLQEYAVATSFGTIKTAGAYASSSRVQHWIGEMCPAK